MSLWSLSYTWGESVGSGIGANVKVRKRWKKLPKMRKTSTDEKNIQGWEKLSKIKATKDDKNYQEWEKVPKMRKTTKGKKNCQATMRKTAKGEKNYQGW